MDQFQLGIIIGGLAVLVILLLSKIPRKHTARQMDISISPIDRSSLKPRYWTALTEREIQVARLVARGLSNSEVAHELDLKTRTIDSHLRIIFQKLHVNSRTQLANVIRDMVDKRE